MKSLFTAHLLLLSFVSFAQLPTPESSVTKSGANVSVNQAYGMSSFSVPIHVLKEGDIELPISVNYTGSGVRVEEVAPRAGLGIGINAGGSITRIIRDKPDEGYIAERPSSFTIGVIFGNLQTGLTFTPQTSYMKANQIYNLSPAFVFMGGWLYNGKPQYDSTKANPNIFDHAPDIFVIEVAGKNIRFLFDENHQIKVLNSEDVKIEYTFNNYSPYLQDTNAPQNLTVRGFVNWTVTLSDGTQYVFGEPQATKPNAAYNPSFYDYSYDLSLVDGTKDPFLLEYVIASLPSTWHLQKIISPVGSNVINFTYQPQYYNFHYLRDYEQIHNPNDCKFPQMVVSNMRNFVPALKKIESANFLVEFNSTEIFNLQAQISNFTSIIPDFSSTRFKDTLRKDVGYVVNDIYGTVLKNILIKDKSTNSKKAFYFDNDYFITTSNLDDLPQSFTKDETLYWGATPTPTSVTYNNFSSTTTGFADFRRLRLKGVYEIQMEVGNYKLLSGHSFEYSVGELPRRLSQARDHWGFYNGKHDNRVKTNLMPVSYNTTTSCTNTSNREANIAYGKAGLLTKVFYPTGSQTTYNYEPHEATNWGLSTTIGGFRVASIVTDDCLTGTRKEVKYNYKQSDNSSSGYVSLKPKYFFRHNTTLGANSIDYVVQSVGQYGFMVGNFLNGGYISYKRVIEKEVGKGYTEYLFHADETNAAITNNNEVFLDQIPLFDFKRGAIKALTHFNETNKPLKSFQYFYTPDNLVKKQTIRGAYLMPIDAIAGRRKYNISVTLGISAGGVGLSLYANFYREEIKSIKYYYDIPLGRFNLEKIIETNYDQNGLNPVIIANENFYESSFHNQITRTKTTHPTGNIIEKTNRYARDFDYSSIFPVSGVSYGLNGQSIINLQNKYMNPLIEQYVKRNNLVIDGKFNEYYETTTNQGLLHKEWLLEIDDPISNYAPAQIEKVILVYNNTLINSFRPDTRYVDKATYLSYNSKGLPTQISAKNGSITKMQYGYNDLLITGILKGFGTPDENSIQYEYNPIYGTTKKTQSNGYYESFTYDGVGRLKEVKDKDNNILKNYKYNYADISCFPNPIVVYGTLSICTGNAVTLTAISCSGTVNWYNSNSALLVSANTYTTPLLSTSTTYYTSCTIGSKESSKSSIMVDVNTNGSPNPPTIDSNFQGNIYSPTLTVTSSSSVLLNSSGCAGITIWEGGTITGQVGASITITPTTDAIYYAKCSLNQCISGFSNPIQIRICNDINEPNETYSQAALLTIGSTINRCLVVNDNDFYQVNINGNTYFIKVIPFLGNFTGFYNLSTSITDNTLTIETSQDPLSIGSTDTKLYLYAADGVTQLAYSDDFGGSFFSKINYNLPISASNIAWSNSIRTKECSIGGQITMKVYVTGLISGAFAQFSTDDGTTWQNANIGSNGFSFTRSATNIYQIFQARASDYTANVISNQYNASCSSINWSANSCSNTSGNVTFTISVTGVAIDSYAEFTIDGTNWFQANIGANGYQVVVPYSTGGTQYFGARPADNRVNNTINGNLTKCSAGTPSNIAWDNTRRTKLCSNGQTTMYVYVSGLTSPAITQFSTNSGITWQNATIGSDGFNISVTSGNINQNFLARASDAQSNIITMDYNAGCTTAINWSTNNCTNISGVCNFFISVIGLATDSYAEFSIDNTNWYRATVSNNGYNVSVPYGTGGIQGFNARPVDNPTQVINGFLNRCQ